MVEDPRLINPIIIERLSYIQHKMMGDGVFENIEEAQAAMEKIVGKNLDEYEPKNDIEKAQILVYDGYEEDDNDKKRKLALKALEYDKLCADAYTLLGFAEVDNAPKALEYFRMGETVFRQRYNEAYFEKNKGEFFYIIETRPYIRNLYYTMLLCEMLEQFDEAINAGLRILELCKDDQIGAYHRVLMLLVTRDRWEEIEQLLEKAANSEENLPEVYFVKSMYYFHIKKDYTKALEYGEQFFRYNEYIDKFFAAQYVPDIHDNLNDSEAEANAKEFLSEFMIAFVKNSERVKAWMSFMRDMENDAGQENEIRRHNKEKKKRREKAKQARKSRRKKK